MLEVLYLNHLFCISGVYISPINIVQLPGREIQDARVYCGSPSHLGHSMIAVVGLR